MPHPRVHLESNTAQDLINHNKKVSLLKTITAGFHIIAMIAGNRWKKRSAIVVIIWVPHFSDRGDHSISQRSLKSGFYMIATIAEWFFSAITEIVATVRKPAFIFNTFRLFTRASILDPVVHLL